MAKSTMSTVDKALSLLRHFSVHHREIGLSELARLAEYDKTTTLRCMTALERHGFVEQDTASRKYRLGLAPLTLARVRERSFPVQAILKPYLDRLASDTGETAHATLVAGNDLLTALVVEPDRMLRVHVDPAAAMPVHATASGLAILAFMPDDRRAALLAEARFEKFTKFTPTSRKAVLKTLVTVRTLGFGRANDTFEDDVTGTAAPFFDATGLPLGAIAIAAVSSRFDNRAAHKIETALIRYAAEITLALGGTTPIDRTPSQLETTS